MADDFIGSLKADWDRSGADAELLRLRRRRWAPPALLAADILGTILLTGFGVGFAMLAARYRDLLFGLSAFVMLPVGLPLVLAGIRIRWRSLRWDDETPEGVLRSSLGRLEATSTILKLGRWAACALFALIIAVWAVALAGLLREPRAILAMITATWFVTGLMMLGWIEWRTRRVARERSGCEALLRQFEVSGRDGAG